MIKDCAVAMKSGRGMCCFSLRPGVNDHSFVVGSWRIIPWRGLDITEGRYSTHLASLASHEMVEKWFDGLEGFSGGDDGLDLCISLPGSVRILSSSS